MDNRTHRRGRPRVICAGCLAKVPARGSRRLVARGVACYVCPTCFAGFRKLMAELKRKWKRRRCGACGDLRDEQGFRRLRILGVEIWLCPACRVTAGREIEREVTTTLERWLDSSRRAG